LCTILPAPSPARLPYGADPPICRCFDASIRFDGG
jgi:hypothetical protein